VAALSAGELVLVKQAVKLARVGAPGALSTGDAVARRLFEAGKFFTVDPLTGEELGVGGFSPQLSALTRYLGRPPAERVAFWVAVGATVDEVEQSLQSAIDRITNPLEGAGRWIVGIGAAVVVVLLVAALAVVGVAVARRS
jgi:hypothetical protein